MVEPAEREILFGPFHVFPKQRLLLEGDKLVRLGSRAWDILIALIERPGEPVSREELMTRVWPDTVVVEGNLPVHMAALRRALGDGHDGNRYVVTIPGRGYSFAAPIKIAETPRPAPSQPAVIAHGHNLPVQLTRLIGRADIVSRLAGQLEHTRLLTITGPPGIGKTSVALAVAEQLIGAYEHGVWLIDLAPLDDPLLVPSAVASVLGLEIRSENPLPGVVAALRDKQMLLVLDNCVHVIEVATSLVIAVLRGAPGIRLLATSREPMRAQGEHVYRLSALESPPAGTLPSAAEALRYPAVQLFVERATATTDEFKLSDADAPIVADICRKLDGLPLAIEFAAARVEAFGVPGLAAHMGDRFRLLLGGRRTVLSRHRTMAATLDWSYSLLTEAQQFVLRGLAIFAGGFTLSAAGAVIADATHPECDVIDQVTELVAKSLVATDVSDTEPRLRLLETTRAYALEKLDESGEVNAVRRRHAECYRDLLQTAAEDKAAIDDRPAAYTAEIDNIRAALTWAFASGGDTSIGVALAAASVPIWFEMSLLTECRGWMEKALGVLDAVDSRPNVEMVLQFSLGTSLMFAQGMNNRAYAALTKASELAERHADFDYRLRSLAGLAAIHQRFQDFQGAVALGRRAEEVVKGSSDPIALATVDYILGSSLQFLGEYAEALTCAQRNYVRAAIPAVRRAQVIRLGRDSSISAGCTMAIIYWAQGLPDRSAKIAQNVLADAEAGNHPFSLCMALAFCGSMIPLRRGDLQTAQRSIARLQDLTQRYGLSGDHAHGLCFEGQLAAKQGDVVAAERLLRAGLKILQQNPNETFYTIFLTGLAEVLMTAGQLEESLAAADEAVQRAERSNALWWLPEALRIKGEVLLLCKGDTNAAEDHFRRSLDLAHRQGALSWELRTATSLARLRRDQGRSAEAAALLHPIYDRFTEGFDTADLRAAKALLDTVR